MSQRQISRSPDLSRLRSDGYDIHFEHGHLVMRGVPYLNAQGERLRCVLVDVLNMTGDDIGRPSDHTMFMGGQGPCDASGAVLGQIFAEPDDKNREIVPGTTINWRLSAKAMEDGNQRREDTDYYSKFLRYVEVLGAPVKVFDTEMSARTYPTVVPDEEENDVFKYVDTASARAGIAAISQKLQLSKVGIVGLGGSGSYIFDLVAKTPVREIYLFDADVFSQHNAFRFPGAASLEDLQARKLKVTQLADVYGRMRHGIVAHPEGLTPENVSQLGQMDFVFLSLDQGEAKRMAVDVLTRAGVPFTECGMGLYQVDQKLAGVVRTTSGSSAKNDHLNERIPYSDGGANNEYAQNIQIADLNALNAALAVIWWKKYFGFYNNLGAEHHAVYTIDGNTLDNGDCV